MAGTTAENITQKVIDHGDKGKTHPRLYQIYASLIKHLHDFVREVKPTETELQQGSDFLARAGRTPAEMPEGEIQMLFDLLGLSELVLVLNESQSGDVTESNMEGPVYVPNAPERRIGERLGQDADAVELLLSGRVLDTEGNPIDNALIDIWQADSHGNYDLWDSKQPKGNFRGRYRTGPDGGYLIPTVVPKDYKVPDKGPCGEVLKLLGRHPWRAAHIHFKVSAAGYVPITTQLYIGNSPYLDSDTVFAVRNAIIPLRSVQGKKQSYTSNNLPAILLAAAINAATEEFQFRVVVLTRATPALGAAQALWLSSVLFGLAHWYGTPTGPVGVVTPLVGGWIVGKSMLATRGVGWAWLMHWISDIIIYAFLILTKGDFTIAPA